MMVPIPVCRQRRCVSCLQVSFSVAAAVPGVGRGGPLNGCFPCGESYQLELLTMSWNIDSWSHRAPRNIQW